MKDEEMALEYSLKINGFTKEDCYDENGELRQFIKSDMDIYLASAKESVKRIEELEQENNRLLDVINNQDVKIAELEQQIEKMKCCANCSNYDRYDRACGRTKFSVIETLCDCTNNWKLRR